LIFISHVWYKSGARDQRRRDSITAKATDFASARAALVAGAHRVAEAGLVVGSAGNMSARTGDCVLITRAGSELDGLVHEDCVEVMVSDGAPAANQVSARPSSELPLHLAIYGATDAAAIVHTHSHYATVLATVADELPAIHYTINHFGGPVRVAHYETFGTDELAASVIEALEDRSGALMANHGAVVTGSDVKDAVGKAILLEWLASLYYHASLLGSPNILSEDELEAVRARARELRSGVKAQAR
jgi:L-fuculose-phosphate aldolase